MCIFLNVKWTIFPIIYLQVHSVYRGFAEHGLFPIRPLTCRDINPFVLIIYYMQSIIDVAPFFKYIKETWNWGFLFQVYDTCIDGPYTPSFKTTLV